MGDDNNLSTLLGFDPATVAIRAWGEGRLDEIKVCIVCSMDTAIRDTLLKGVRVFKI